MKKPDFLLFFMINKKTIATSKASFSTIFGSSKKGIGPVVALSLLIVVSVIAVAGFQGWYQTYQLSVLTGVESESSVSDMNSKIEAVSGSVFYFNNANKDDIIISSVKIDGYDCNVSGNYSSGISPISLENCVGNVTTSTPDLVVITDKEIYSKKLYLKNFESLGSSEGSGGEETTPLLYDDFSSDLSGWTQTRDSLNPPSIVSEELIITSEYNKYSLILSDSIVENNGSYIKAKNKWSDIQSGGLMFIIKAADINNFYAYVPHVGMGYEHRIYKVSSGSWTLLNGTFTNATLEDTYYDFEFFQLENNTLVAKRDEDIMISVIDNTISGDKVGFRAFNGISATIDDVYVR